MELEAVREFWPALLRRQQALAQDPALPLVGLRGLESSFGLTPLDVDVDPPESIATEPGGYPRFARIGESEIVALRELIRRGSPSAAVEVWAEGLLRFCELRLATLKRRSLEVHGTRETVRSLYVQIVALFVDRHRACDDVRLINAALKLADLPWTRSTLSTAASGDALVSAALCARNRILIAHALRELDRP